MIKPLTSFRFFFALMVFSSHLSLLNLDDAFFIRLYKSVFEEGYLGVSFFFILSGFVLALNYKAKLLNGDIKFKEFLIARIARIYPLHLFTILIAIPISLHGITSEPFFWFGKLVINGFLLQSFIPIPDIYFSFNGASWSISDEMFFYAMFPLIISLNFKFKKIFTYVLILSLLIPIGIYLSSDNLVHRVFYINPFFRIIDFLLGILLYEIYKQNYFEKLIKKKISATFLEILSICLFIVFFIFHNHISKGYRFSCYYWIPMMLIILVFAYQAGYISTFLSNKVFVFLGEISFGFYMIHQLSIIFISAVNYKFSLFQNDFLLIGFVFIMTLLGSYLSYIMIEKPSNKFIKLKYSRKKLSNSINS